MKKYLFLVLFLTFLSNQSSAQSENNEYETELRLLERQERAQEEKEDSMVDKIANTDSVSVQNSAVIKSPLVISPETNSQENKVPKKNRRIPSR